MKKFIDSLQLRLSDLFLAIGFLCWAIFLVFGQLFMQFQNPNDVALPLWAAILCFIVMVGSWGYYLYLELYVRKVPFNKIIAIINFFLESDVVSSAFLVLSSVSSKSLRLNG